MSSISIRLAENKHLAEIPKIELAASAMYSAVDLPQSVRYRVTDMPYLREALNDERLWVALHDELPVGFALASVLDDVGYLDELDVRPEFGRQGIGTRLVSTVVDWARAAEFPCLTLVTFRHLAWNAPFYEKLGFHGLDLSQHSAELTGLFEEERHIGINIANRVAMRLDL